ncbi:hippurate hydrolase [Sphingomonas sp. YR710]|jgi:hippurate hydrolase|uniref:amidohydrolase n=1 Tax=Sphingomonas sp. YR710 TaxID=1882773 RepID=UPI000891FF25|nr:amidohydrolase [Sphingomonas sp. YR710]SDD02428.1 hippurate hydrolase [Sphingomonas sp. YR710]
MILRFPLVALALAIAAPASADPLNDAIAADMPGLMATYHDLHIHPELSFREIRSSAILAEAAKKAGFEVSTGVGKTGVVAVLRNGPGPVLLLRADMDALPVTEQTGLTFASTVPGVMHACGHDTHMTAWIGVARRMAAMKDQWSGTLVMIGQPAEEIGQGARAMLKDGLYSRFPKPTVTIAFHDSASLPAGTIGYVDGYTMANVDSVDILVKGIGGHGAYPHLTKDPIVLAARIVTSLQTLISREIDPLESGVVTVGSFQAGTKHNIIPSEAKLQITVRSYTPEVRKQLLDGIARIAKGEAIAAGMPDDAMPIVTLQDQFTPATFNTHKLTAEMADRFAARFGKDRVRAVRAQMGGEDFSEYHLADPANEALLFWVGGVPQAKWDAAKGDVTKLPSLHSPFWAPDAPKVISTAIEAMTTAAIHVLAKNTH